MNRRPKATASAAPLAIIRSAVSRAKLPAAMLSAGAANSSTLLFVPRMRRGPLADFGGGDGRVRRRTERLRSGRQGDGSGRVVARQRSEKSNELRPLLRREGETALEVRRERRARDDAGDIVRHHVLQGRKRA